MIELNKYVQNKYMNKPTYFLTQEYRGSFEKAISAITQSLKNEGFGILTQIDVSKTLKQKLNVDYPQYKILGACNPTYAYKALQAEKTIGLLLPCNVIVYKDGNKVYISIMKPTAALTLSNNSKVTAVAEVVENKLINALKVAVESERRKS